MQKSKYFTAVLTPASIASEILTFQKEIEEKYGAKHAQKAPPHITVIPPFDASMEAIENYLESLGKIHLEKKEIEIKLDGFQTFNRRTLFVDIARNDAFEAFCKSIKLHFNRQKIIPQRDEKHFFVPHITLANKDLRKKDFITAEQEFKEKEFHRSFRLKELVLLKLIGKQWEVFNTISLK